MNKEILDGWFNQISSYEKLNFKEAKELYIKAMNTDDSALKKEYMEKIILGTLYVPYNYILKENLSIFSTPTYDMNDIINTYNELWIQKIYDGDLLKYNSFAAMEQHLNVTKMGDKLGIDDVDLNNTFEKYYIHFFLNNYSIYTNRFVEFKESFVEAKERFFEALIFYMVSKFIDLPISSSELQNDYGENAATNISKSCSNFQWLLEGIYEGLNISKNDSMINRGILSDLDELDGNFMACDNEKEKSDIQCYLSDLEKELIHRRTAIFSVDYKYSDLDILMYFRWKLKPLIMKYLRFFMDIGMKESLSDDFVDSCDMEKLVVDKSLNDEIAKALELLSEREKKVIKGYYGLEDKEYTLKEMGQMLGVSSACIGQNKQKALKKLWGSDCLRKSNLSVYLYD